MEQLKVINSASIILQKSSGEVFLAKRSNLVSFFPGFWVFPGGKIDDELPEDWSGTEFEVIETIFRELYEEVGIVVGSDTTIPSTKRKLPFLTQNYDDSKRREFKDQMEYVGKKDTPPFRRKIYSAAYYHIKGDIVDDLNPIVDGQELVEGEWIYPQDAIDQWYSGKKKIPPPILHLLRNLQSEHFASITLSETYLPIGLQTKVEFVPGYQLIPISSNTIDPFFNTNLVIVGDKDVLLVDPGANSEAENHFNQILLSLPDQPKVFLTHHHRDHWDGLGVIEDIYPNAIVMAHSKTLDRVDTTLSAKSVGDGDKIQIEDKVLDVIVTPGHTDGHLALYDGSKGVLIAGDHVVGYGSAVLDPNSGSMIDYFDTTRKLIDLNPSIIFPAHGPPNFNPSGLLQQYLDHRTERETSILNSIEKGNYDLDEIVKDVYQDVPEKMWEYAKRNIQLHIDKLDKEDRLPGDYSG